MSDSREVFIPNSFICNFDLVEVLDYRILFTLLELRKQEHKCVEITMNELANKVYPTCRSGSRKGYINKSLERLKDKFILSGYFIEKELNVFFSDYFLNIFTNMVKKGYFKVDVDEIYKLNHIHEIKLYLIGLRYLGDQTHYECFIKVIQEGTDVDFACIRYSSNRSLSKAVKIQFNDVINTLNIKNNKYNFYNLNEEKRQGFENKVYLGIERRSDFDYLFQIKSLDYFVGLLVNDAIELYINQILEEMPVPIKHIINKKERNRLNFVVFDEIKRNISLSKKISNAQRKNEIEQFLNKNISLKGRIYLELDQIEKRIKQKRGDN